MQVAQRILLLILLMIVVLLGVHFVSLEREHVIQRQWEEIQTELFLETISREARITSEVYEQYVSKLNYSGTVSEVILEEYQKEQDLDGTAYYYLVSFEELKECIFREGKYSLRHESVIKVTVVRRSKKQDAKKEYYVIVAGKE